MFISYVKYIGFTSYLQAICKLLRCISGIKNKHYRSITEMAGRKFMSGWSEAMMDTYIAKKKAKECYDQDRPISKEFNNVVNVGVMPFGFTPTGTAPNNLLKATITEQALTILALTDATAETNIEVAAAKRAGGVPGGLLFTPARVGITLWDGSDPTEGVSGLTGKPGVKKYKTRSGTIPFGDIPARTDGEAATRNALADKIRAMPQTANKLRGLTFKPESLRSGRIDKGLTKTALTPATAALTY